ncbi:MAG: endonuclease domain-containing protein [Brachybacterium sp.]|nr:endonuclease domain-containing protein [Brachybacterium sp.]MDN6401168.1 endonuclease domain-containing protein [Brachybacterium sp.]
MPSPPAPLPDTVPWRVFTRAEALRAGVSAERLRRSDLRRLRPGLLARTGWGLTESDIAAAICRTDPSAVVVGASAARMQGIPLPQDEDSWTPEVPVQIAIPGGRRGSDDVVRWRGPVLHDGEVRSTRYRLPVTPDGAALPLAPLRLTTRARTWRDLAPSLSHSWLVVVADHLVRRPRPQLELGRDAPWCTLEELDRACTGRRAGALRRALEQVRTGADSPPETLLRLAFVAAGLPEPALNVPLIGADGVPRHEPDFLWPQYRVCAEYEGKHHNEAAQIERDIARARRVASAGWTEVRLSARDARHDCADAVLVVREALSARGWSSSADAPAAPARIRDR